MAQRALESLQNSALRGLLSVNRLNRMAENAENNGTDAYTPMELMTDLRTGIFSELYRGQKTDAYRRNLQRSFIDIASDYIKKEKANDEEILKSDVSALMRGTLSRLRNDLRNRKNATSDGMSRLHYEDLIARIDMAFENN